jgi:hypothetical protein
MTYDELKERFEYSTWDKVSTKHYDCYSHDALYMFFSSERQYIELMIAGEGITLATFPVNPENVEDIGEAVNISLGEGRIQFPLPRDTQRIEREREEEYFRNRKKNS